MKVYELAAILEHVDPNHEVHISTDHGCMHVTEVAVQPARRYDWSLGGSGRYREGDRAVPSLRLRGRITWFEKEPFFYLRGRFRRGAELEARLDSDG